MPAGSPLGSGFIGLGPWFSFYGPPRPRRGVAVDGIKAKLNGEWLYLWAAIDVNTKEGKYRLYIYASWRRSGLNAYIFIRKVLRACPDKPLILVDGEPWHPCNGL
jgi:transposase-like protein